MKVIKDIILIKWEENNEIEQKSASGIIINTKEDQRKSLIGEVLEVGGEVKEIKKGDKVVYKKQYSQEETIKGQKYVFLREGDILMVLD